MNKAQQEKFIKDYSPIFLIVSIVGGISQVLFKLAGYENPRFLGFGYSIISLIWMYRTYLSVIKDEDNQDINFDDSEEIDREDEDW